MSENGQGIPVFGYCPINFVALARTFEISECSMKEKRIIVTYSSGYGLREIIELKIPI